MIRPESLANETRIVWETDPDAFDYVRQGMVLVAGYRRRGPVRAPGQRIGYAEVSKDEPGPAIIRRVFWAEGHDRHAEPDGVYAHCAPTEAVDPRTVAPGVVGRMTDRALGAARTSPRAELAAAIRLVNVEYAKLPPDRQSRVRLVADGDLDAVLLGGDRDHALADVARWRDAQLAAIEAVAR